MRLRQGILLAVLTALAFALAGVAGADTSVYTDPAGDVAGPSPTPDYDIVRTSAGHRGGFLVQSTRTRGPHTDDSPAPEFLIRVGSGRVPDFRVTAGGVFRIGTGHGARKVGVAHLNLPNAHVMEILFRARAINNPRKYDWRVVMGAVHYTVDRAPAHYVTHVLR
jgi:hypothetical protein